jgi:hypothetical protein|tara:strand:+ start:2642 stop:2917 length:276 start_codon:yes stop_codon:yes gene_type:complete
MKVKNLISDKGNVIPNQFQIVNNNTIYFQSYETIIAKINKRTMYCDEIILDTHALNYSRTTSKYLYKFLNMNRKEIENLIKKKEIKLKNLN